MTHPEVELAQKKKELEDQLVLVGEWWGTTSKKCRKEMLGSMLLPDKCPVCTLKNITNDLEYWKYTSTTYADKINALEKEKEVLSAKLAVYEEQERIRAENRRIWQIEEDKKKLLTVNPGMENRAKTLPSNTYFYTDAKGYDVEMRSMLLIRRDWSL